MLAFSIMRLVVAFVLIVTGSTVWGQDVLSIGSGTNEVAVTVTKTTANLANGLAFKVLFDGEAIASMTFSRTGPFASASPLYERSQQGSGWFAYVVLFSSPTNLTGEIGLLSITAQPSATPGSTVGLVFHPSSATLSNQDASTVETVANGLLSLVNGSVVIGGTIGSPSEIVATASGTGLVDVSWNAVAGADHYQVWRSVDGSAYVQLASPAASPYADSEVVPGKAWLYRIRSVNALGATSPLSNPDVATTIIFTDDPAVANVTPIRLVHFTQLRTAVNAFRASTSLSPLVADPTLAAGAAVRATHLTALRNGLNEARDAAGMAAIAFGMPLTIVRASHVNELRGGLK